MPILWISGVVLGALGFLASYKGWFRGLVSDLLFTVSMVLFATNEFRKHDAVVAWLMLAVALIMLAWPIKVSVSWSIKVTKDEA